MAKQFRNIFLALIVTVNFSSCSYHYFYPQRVNVYSFDSSGQTKGVIEPYFNMLNLHLGIAHSFSDHIFSSVEVQGDAKFFDWFGGEISHTSDGWLSSISIGYYSKGERKCGYEIIPCFAYEKNFISISNYTSFGGATYDNWFEEARSIYMIPSLQTSFYIKGLKANFYSAIRFSYLFSDATYPHIQYYNAPELRKSFSETFLIEPTVQFSFSHSKTMRYFISAHIVKSKNYYLDFIPPFQAGFKFMIE